MWLDVIKGMLDCLLLVVMVDDVNCYFDFFGVFRFFRIELLVCYNCIEQLFCGFLVWVSMCQVIVILYGMFEVLCNVFDEDGGSYICMNFWVLVCDVVMGEEDDEIEEVFIFEEWDVVQQIIEGLLCEMV